MGTAVIKRLLIANRGEIAVRIVHACRELGIESVAVYSAADVAAPHVTLADRAVPIGPAPAASSYLSIPQILAAVRASGADAVHPGYGFLSENAAFAEACEAAGIVFVGPPARVIGLMGSKIEARQLMRSAGIAVVPGETPDDQSDEGIRRAIDRVELPVLIKASAGGGGKGMRRVNDPAEIADAVRSARREAIGAFGDGTLYVERLISRPRHIEVQILADNAGHVVHLFERECSVQRRHQKIIEESPSTAVSPSLRRRITDAAVEAARACDYRNAGTIEFLVDLSAGRDRERFYFLEMNTRLQVEHPVTEQVTGIDLVGAQLRIASGRSLNWTADEISTRGHAIEARIYAEDPDQSFLPQAGRILLYREPRIPGVRIDSGIAEGNVVSVHYDPMLAKVIASAETRDEAITRLACALREYPVLGIRTNIAFLLRILEHPRFRAGEVDTSFLDGEGASLTQAEQLDIPPAVRAALDSFEQEHSAPARTGVPDLARDPWKSLHEWRA